MSRPIKRKATGARRAGALASVSKASVEQRVADEDGGGLPVDDVTGGLAAARVGVVEAGQIVLHERRAVHELDGGGEAADHLVVAAAAVAVGDEAAEDRTRAAAAGEDGVVHGAVQARRRRVARRQRPQEPLLDESLRADNQLLRRGWFHANVKRSLNRPPSVTLYPRYGGDGIPDRREACARSRHASRRATSLEPRFDSHL